MSISTKQSRIADQFWNSLFNSDAIAVIGANNSLGSWGFDAFRAALDSTRTNPQRQVYAINPKEQVVQGTAAYPSVLDIPGSRPGSYSSQSRTVPSILRQCVQKAQAAVIISADSLRWRNRQQASE